MYIKYLCTSNIYVHQIFASFSRPWLNKIWHLQQVWINELSWIQRKKKVTFLVSALFSFFTNTQIPHIIYSQCLPYNGFRKRSGSTAQETRPSYEESMLYSRLTQYNTDVEKLWKYYNLRKMSSWSQKFFIFIKLVRGRSFGS